MKHNWTYKKLGEVATLTGGFTPKADELFPKGKYPYFKVSDMNTAGNEVVLTKTPSFVLDSKKFFPKGAIVFPKNGAAVSTNKKRILGQDSIVDLNTCTAILTSDINVKFAYYWFCKLDFKTLVRGGALPTLDLKGLRSLQIPIPSLDKQKSIVQELDGINHLIDLQEEQLREYDRLAQSLFYTTFGDPVSNPKGWEVKKLSEIVSPQCTLSYGIVQPGDGVEEGVPVVRPVDLIDTFVGIKGLKKTTVEIASSYKRTVLTGHELLMCVRGTIGIVGLALEELSGCNVTRGITPILFQEEASKWLVFHIMKTEEMKVKLAELTRGIALKGINMADVRKLPIIYPPLPLQQTFAAQIEAIEQQKALIRRSLDQTRTLLAARMQYYFE